MICLIITNQRNKTVRRYKDLKKNKSLTTDEGQVLTIRNDMSAYKRKKFRAHLHRTLFKKQEGRCFNCYKKWNISREIGITLDHYIPKACFGKTKQQKQKRDEEKNFVLLCASCNTAKADTIPILSIEDAWINFKATIKDRQKYE